MKFTLVSLLLPTAAEAFAPTSGRHGVRSSSLIAAAPTQPLSPPSSTPKIKRKKPQGTLRVNRALRSTHSRRETNRFISQGRLSQNGVVVSNPDHLLLSGDTVQLDGNFILWEEKDLPSHRYVKYHKPRGVVCTTDRRVKNNILDAIESTTEAVSDIEDCKSTVITNYDDKEHLSQSARRRVYPIGRLDADSTGLILLTSNGDIVNPLLRSGDDKSKEYHVITEPMATNDNIRQLCEGVIITTLARREGDVVPITAKTLPCLVKMRGDEGKIQQGDDATIKHDDNVGLSFVIKEGRNRQIRKMCSTLGLEVTLLHRVEFAGITLDGCEQGECVDLTEEEMISIGGGPTREERRSPEERARRKLKKQNKKKGKRI